MKRELTYAIIDLAALNLARAFLSEDVQLAATAEKSAEDAAGIGLAAGLLLVDLACLAAVLDGRSAAGGDEGHGGDDGDDAGELHFC